jgi:hypothetical protein
MTGEAFGDGDWRAIKPAQNPAANASALAF